MKCSIYSHNSTEQTKCDSKVCVLIFARTEPECCIIELKRHLKFKFYKHFAYQRNVRVTCDFRLDKMPKKIKSMMQFKEKDKNTMAKNVFVFEETNEQSGYDMTLIIQNVS